MAALCVAVCVFSCGAAVAQTAQAAGHATNALTGEPLQNAFIQRVSGSPYPSTYTDADGAYALTAAPNSSNTFLAWHPDYVSPPRWKDYIGTGTATIDWSLTPHTVSHTVYDSFNRPNSLHLGATEDSAHYDWIAGPTRSSARINGGSLELAMNNPGETGDGVSIACSFLPSDFDMTCVVKSITSASGANCGMICYRQDPTKGPGNSQYGFGMALFMRQDGTGISLAYYWYGGLNDSGVNGIADYTPGTPIDWSQPHTVRIRANGYHHEVWLDGDPTPIISFFCTQASHEPFDYSVSPPMPRTGYIGFYRSTDTAMMVDNIEVKVLEEDTGPGTGISIAEAKALPNGTPVVLTGAYVTAVYDGSFYVEDPSRACGMKILGSTSANIGAGVRISGTVGTADDEKYIAATETVLTGETSFISPLAMTGRSAFGPGVSPVGLLTKTFGIVTSLSADHTYFTMDDGSPIASGVKVIMAPRGINSFVSHYVVVNGIVSTITPDTRVIRAAEEPFSDYNGSGYWNPGESYTDTNSNGAYDGIVVLDAPTVAPPPGTVAYAATAPSGTSVTLTDKVVTAGTDQMKSPWFFYIQENGVGIRVRSSTVVRQGDRVTVVGTVRRASDGGTVVHRNGEREVNATSVTFTYGPYTMPAPVVLTNRQVGGGPSTQIDTDGYPCQPGVWASSTGANCGYDQIDEAGANNVGVYCQVSGTVVYADDAARFFYINDGSNVQDGGWVSGAPSPPGIRVLAPPGAPLTGIGGKSVTVVGVVGSMAQSDAGSPSGPCGTYVRNIRVVRATPEMFLDLNQNGFWDAGERYLDTNGSGTYDGIRASGVAGPSFVSRFDRYGTLILRGAPFMPRGLYCYDVGSGTLNAAKNQGFNAVQCFDAMSPSDLTTLNSVGLKVFPSLHDVASRPAWMAVKTDPAIAAWYLNDEPEWHGEDPATNLASYNWVYSQDGTHPVGNSHADVNRFGDYAASDDMCWIDRYPIGNAGGQWCIPTIADFVDTARAAHGGDPYYPAWQYVQMFKESPSFAMPSVAEFRAMIYTAMSHYVKGYFYFSNQQGDSDWQALWSEVANVNSEMNTLRSFFTLPWLPVELTNTNPVYVKVGGYRVGGSVLLVVVNADKDNAQSATITLPGMPNNAVLTAPIGGSGLTLSGRQFTYTFAPCEVRVLLWGSIPTPP